MQAALHHEQLPKGRSGRARSVGTLAAMTGVILFSVFNAGTAVAGISPQALPPGTEVSGDITCDQINFQAGSHNPGGAHLDFTVRFHNASRDVSQSFDLATDKLAAVFIPPESGVLSYDVRMTDVDSGDPIIDESLLCGAAGTFVAFTPTRIVDSRLGLGVSGKVAPDDKVAVQVLGQGGMPTSGVGAVVATVRTLLGFDQPYLDR